MKGYKSKCGVVSVVVLALSISFAGLYDLLKPISNGCTMTYMYPTYIPISSTRGLSSVKYGLYLYHEGWKKIDFNHHLKKLSGVPVLFIPGNGGSFKQVRSLAAESDRAFQGGPPDRTFYHEASLTSQEGGMDSDISDYRPPNHYTHRLDWFAVDLEGEHSAMDGRILEEHTEYVVYAIHRILDQYKESRDTREKEGAAASGSSPKSVILVGHSMGGFVARAAVIHPNLRKSAIETVITLSSPHQSPPLALQPSLGQYFARVNDEWRKGYDLEGSQVGNSVSNSLLSHIVVVSISGAYNDYQVRTKLESLDGIVPPAHGFLISSTGMKNAWLSMEHQAILWCNQLVVQVSHTLLSLIDSRRGQPFTDTRKRLAIFTRMLRSGVPILQSQPSQQSSYVPMKIKDRAGLQAPTLSACPSNAYWGDDGLEKDLYIQTSTVTVLAMDGRRRWLDIHKLGSSGKSHFVFVTNLAPCSGVRLHLWPEKGESTSEFPARKGVLDVTSMMVHIPSGPAPRQIEPGSQTEQAPPSAVFQLGPEEMHGFRFLTISVAPRPTISGRPPPAASMAVGQFFNPEEGKREFSPQSMLLSMYSHKDMFLKEEHSLSFSLSFGISLGLLPVTLSLKTISCGIKNSGLPAEEAGDMEHSRLCKLRCFPPVALAWDSTSGLHIFPNLYSETIIVDSSPALWSSTEGSDRTSVLLLVDPHCSYEARISVSLTAAAKRFLLLYGSQIVGLSIAVVFFAMMRQARAWDLDLPIPSMLTALEYNMRRPLQFFLLAILPIFISLFFSLLVSHPFPPLSSYVVISLICYLFANGSTILLIVISQSVFYVTAIFHVFIKTRWQLLEREFSFIFLHWFINLISSFFSSKVVRFLRGNPLLITALSAIIFVSFVHPAVGLFILLSFHTFSCHSALCSFLTASFRKNELFDYKSEGNDASQLAFTNGTRVNQNSNLGENSSKLNSFRDTQLEIFYHMHGLLILHFLATIMFGPSLVAWLQRIGLGQSFPRFLDIALCIGVILHGTSNSKAEFNAYYFPGIPGREMRMSFIYLIAGYYSYLSGLALAPYRVFYAMATVGAISFGLRMLQRRYKEKGEAYFVSRKHSHRH